MPTVSLPARLHRAFTSWKAIASIASSSFFSFTVFWTFYTALALLCHPRWASSTPGAYQLILMGFLSLVAGTVYRLPKLSVKVPLRNINTPVEVVFGDLFAQDGHKAIGVNEFFDSELGECVSPTSLHGQFIQRVFKGQSVAFDERVQASLDSTAAAAVPRQKGKCQQYPIGTTAVIEDMPGTKYLLVALTRTNLDNLKAEAGVSELWQALSGLWEAVRIHSGGYPVNVPLLGSGLAQVPLPPQQLLRLMLMSLVTAAKSREITPGTIRIVLHPARFSEFDLGALRGEWS
jgi:hypothetical protein